MRTSGNGLQQVSPEQRTFYAFHQTKDGQGGFAVLSSHFDLRGQAIPDLTGTASFAASSASGASETVNLKLPDNMDPPDHSQIIVINHTDVAVDWTLAQTVDDFVAGSGLAYPTLTQSQISLAAGASETTNFRFPFTMDGPLVLTFTLASASTNGGKVGAQIRVQ